MKLYLAKNLKRFPSKARVLALLKNPQCFLALFLIVFLCGNAILNWNCISQTWESFAKNKNITTVPAKLEAFPKTYHKTITDKFYFKDEFINLDGLAARIAQRRLLNGVYLCGNNYLSEYFPNDKKLFESILKYADNTIVFTQELKKMGIPFIYCQPTRKPDNKDAKFPKGLENGSEKAADLFVKKLKSAQIDLIDFRPISRNVDGIFFRTDNHWKPWSALWATQILIQKISGIFPDEKINPQCSDFSQWNVKNYHNYFLGSYARRTGKYFAGVESFPFVYPNFKTHISFAIPEKRVFRTGDFWEANIEKRNLEKKDYFHSYPYLAYIGGINKQVVCTNHQSPNKLRILMINDSFGFPMQTFLSTAFKEVYAIDPRVFKGTALLRAVNEYKPDLVFMIFYPGTFFKTKEISNYGNAQNQLPSGIDILPPNFNRKNIIVGENNKPHSNILLPAKFVSNQSYELKINKIKILKGNPQGIIVALWDKKQRKLVREWIFPAKCFNETLRWGFSVPQNSNPEDCALTIFSGFTSQNIGNQIELEDISLTTM